MLVQLTLTTFAVNTGQRRHISATVSSSPDTPHPLRFELSPIWTIASGVPMDILMPDGSTRIPTLARNAGGRQFHNGMELNSYLSGLNAAGGINGQALPLVDPSAHFNDSFNSFDLRLTREFKLGERFRLAGIAEAFNLFNVTNILGASNTNYSGFQNVLVPNHNDPTHSSAFGKPVSTAGGVFGSGGPRAFQLAARLTF